MTPEIQSDFARWAEFLDAADHPWVALLITAALVSALLLCVHAAVVLAFGRLSRRAPLLRLLVRRTRSPLALAWPALGLEMLVGGAPDDLPMIALARQGAMLLLIAALSWTGLRAVAAIGDGVLDTYGNGDAHDVYQARRVQTQARLLTRMLKFLVALVGTAALLMTFPGVRQIGTSLLASAGIAGIVIGFAARPVLSNLLAGLQIAITQPIRIDDVVIIENEWGWIEQIHSTFVVVRVWDQRRLIVPLNDFIEKPFQNWTRDSSELIGTVFWWLDYRMPLAPLRAELERLCRAAPEWDGRVVLLQVTDSSERAMQLRALVSAADAPSAWDLRCRIREGVIDFVQREYPQFLPQLRSDVASTARSEAGGPEPGP